MCRLRKVLTVAVSVWFFGSGVLCLPAAGREVKLAICPRQMPVEPAKWLLLPPEGLLTDGDAVPLYDKALKALPGKDGDDKINEWLNTPVDQLPVEQVESVLEHYRESLRCVAGAVRCRQCNWPEWKPGKTVVDHEGYRRLAFAIRLWARREIAAARYDEAMAALQAGFGMARHLGQAPTILQVQIGIAVGGVMCNEIEVLVQREGAPNVHPALASLPKPFVNMEKAIAIEAKAASSGLRGRLFGKQLAGQMKPVHDRLRVLAKRFDSQLAILQCVEAIRSHAASHSGELPGTLADVAAGSVPKDPMSDKPFRYTLTGSAAALESAAPGNAAKPSRLRYAITVKK